MLFRRSFLRFHRTASDEDPPVHAGGLLTKYFARGPTATGLFVGTTASESLAEGAERGFLAGGLRFDDTATASASEIAGRTIHDERLTRTKIAS